jgi:hypothetical protein
MKRDDAIKWLMEKCGPDEEVYPLIGRDVFAAKLVQQHADQMYMAGVRYQKVEEAWKCATRMRTVAHKIPD